MQQIPSGRGRSRRYSFSAQAPDAASGPKRVAANRMKMGYQCGTVLPAPFGISPVNAGKAPDARKVFRGKAFEGLPANTRPRLPGTLPQALSMAPNTTSADSRYS